MMTYKEYVKWYMGGIGRFQRFLFFLSSNPPDLRVRYNKYVLLSIQGAKSLEEVRELVDIASPGDK